MTITVVTATPVRVPLPHAPYPSDGAGTESHWGKRGRITPLRPQPLLEYVLVRIETDEGVAPLALEEVEAVIAEGAHGSA